MKMIKCSHAVKAKRLAGVDCGRDVYTIILNYTFPWAIYIDDSITIRETIKIIRDKYICEMNFPEIDDVAKMFYDGDLSLSEKINFQDDIDLCHGLNFIIENVPTKFDVAVQRKFYIDDEIFPERLFTKKIIGDEGESLHSKIVKLIIEETKKRYISNKIRYGDLYGEFPAR